MKNSFFLFSKWQIFVFKSYAVFMMPVELYIAGQVSLTGQILFLNLNNLEKEF